MSIRTALLALDRRLQDVVAVKAPVFTRDSNVLDGDGIYSSDEWSRTRRLGSAQHGIDGRQYDSDARYLAYIHAAEPNKVTAGRLLAQAFDFSRYARVLELGCGDMIQALEITRAWPHLHYVATDFDPYVVARCSELPVLAGVQKQVFDVLNDPHERFAGFDLILSWGLDAALDDAQLVATLASIRRYGVPWLMCSPSTIGPILHLHQRSTERRRRELLAERKLRMHGWARSVAYFARLARTAGVSMRSIGRHGMYTCIVFGEAEGVK